MRELHFVCSRELVRVDYGLSMFAAVDDLCKNRPTAGNSFSCCSPESVVVTSLTWYIVLFHATAICSRSIQQVQSTEQQSVHYYCGITYSAGALTQQYTARMFTLLRTLFPPAVIFCYLLCCDNSSQIESTRKCPATIFFVRPAARLSRSVIGFVLMNLERYKAQPANLFKCRRVDANSERQAGIKDYCC